MGGDDMAILLVRHRVANFEAWKQAFDSMTGVRKEHGWLGHTVSRDANDPNMVTIVNRVKDLAGAKRYGGSDALRQAMQKAGVQGPPEIAFLEEADEKTY
jgi:quinol monooxygenase YgiN